MNRPKAGGWIAATVFLSIVLAAAAWFFAISPTLANAADTREQTVAQDSQNDISRARISRLQAQFKHMDELQAQLDALHLQIPTTDQMAAYRRELAAAAANQGVTIVSLQVGVASAIAPPEAATGKDDTTTDSTATESPAADASPTPKPTAPAQLVYALPVTVDVLGAYDAVLRFLQDMQATTQRLYFVEQLNATTPDPADATGGKPAIVAGDIDLIISGYVYVLPAQQAAAPTPTPSPTGTATPPALPQPNGRNPVLPLP